MYSYFFVLLNLLLIINCIDGDVPQSVNVTLKAGQVNGQQTIIDGNILSTFLGIPFAKPPIGELRFKKPVKIEKWSDPINATKWPNPCVQSPNQSLNSVYDTIYKNTNFSEDCLYLNVFSPIDTKNISTNNLKAVMFFIHGGSLNSGSSSHFLYDGKTLSSKGDVIVVTINYRLHVFGFLYSGTDDAPGNVGLWDQALALEWVNDNIRYFGGDPQRITIFGESAGSWSVSLLILSPITRNLFQNAIMMSGAVLNKEGLYQKEHSNTTITKWLNAVKQIGCEDTKSNSFTLKIIQCLQKIDVKTLLKLMSLELSPYPVIDSHFFTDFPLNSLKSGSYKKDLKLLIGSMEDEGSLLLPYYDAVKYDWRTPKNITYNEAVADLKYLNKYLLGNHVNDDDLIKVYFKEIPKTSTNSDQLRRTIGIAIGDYFLSCPTILFAKTLYDNDRNGSNVYEYYFKSRIGEGKLFCSKWMHACHGNDLWPVFGLPFSLYNQSTDEDRKESNIFIDLFANFAKLGKPSPQYNIDWPQYHSVNNTVIAPYFEYNGALNSEFKNQLKTVECGDDLYKKYFFQL